MTQLSQATKNLLLQYQTGDKASQLKDGAITIHVDEVAAKVAVFYERIRGIIDWREEHLLKRGAIERMLKRRVMVGLDTLKEENTRESVAEPLVLELIRGGHYPNDQIPESKISDVQKALDKYIFILKNTPQAENGQEAMKFYNWFLSIASCEIEEILSSSYKERALIAFMFESMKEKIVLNEGAVATKPVKEDEKNIQIYIAVQKALFKLDSPVIGYHLIKYKYPNWKTISQEELLEVAKNMLTLRKKIERNINHPLANKFYQICERYDTPYLLLGDIVSTDPQGSEEKFSKPEIIEAEIKDAYNKRVKTLKNRLARAALYATLSIFITKIIVGMAIEIPIDKYITHEYNLLSLIINIIIPPVLMYLLVSTIKVPGRENLERAVLETMKIIHQTEKKDVYEIKTFKARKSFVISGAINFIYILTFALTLSLIIYILRGLKFSPLSIIIFVLFTSLIAFTGTRIRQRSKELEIIEEKEGFFNMILDLFAIPLVEVGKWLTQKWQKYNFISALFNILIDMPFMVFIEFIEQWRYFLKEKKEKIQ